MISEFLISSNFDKFVRPPLLGQMVSDKFHLLLSIHGQRSISNYSIQKNIHQIYMSYIFLLLKKIKLKNNKRILYKIRISNAPLLNPYSEHNHTKPWFNYKIKGPINKKIIYKTFYTRP